MKRKQKKTRRLNAEMCETEERYDQVEERGKERKHALRKEEMVRKRERGKGERKEK